MEQVESAKNKKSMRRYRLDDPELKKIYVGYGNFLMSSDGNVNKISSTITFPKFSDRSGEVVFISCVYDHSIPINEAKKNDFFTIDVTNMSIEDKHNTYVVPRNIEVSNGFYYDVFEEEILLLTSDKNAVKFFTAYRNTMEVLKEPYSKKTLENVIGLSTDVALKCISRMDHLNEYNSEDSLDLDDVFTIAENI